MSDDDPTPASPEDELDTAPTADELRAAEALRAALEQPVRARGAAPNEELDVALRARAILGHAAPLDEAVRRAAVGAAIREVEKQVSRSASRARVGVWFAVAAVLLVAAGGSAVAVRFVAGASRPVVVALPEDAYARPSDSLFGEGIAPEQRASARLDTIVNSRTRGYFAVVAANLAAEGGGGPR